MTAVSTGPPALALTLVALAMLVVPSGGPRVDHPARRGRDPRLRRAVVVGIGTASAGSLLGFPWWCDLAAGGLAVVAVRIVPRRRHGPGPVELREVAAVLDLVAVCLDAGLTIAGAIGAALSATRHHENDPRGPASNAAQWTQDGAPGPDALGALAEVVALLTLGADPAAAWRPAAGHEVLDALAGAAQRSTLGGVRLADAAREAAADVRARCRRVGARSAGRASVAITAPLTVCFLPAFVCLGLAPVIVSLVSTLHLW